MVRCLLLHLPALAVCLAVVQLLSPCSARFAVVGHPEPILATVGDDAELPCHLCPNMSAEYMKLMWERPSPRQVVHTYEHGQEDTPAAEYRGRTSILREDITEGKAALRIRDVRASDGGNYRCRFQDGDFCASALVELKVEDKSGPFSQSTEPWMVTLVVISVILALLLLVVGALCFLRQRQQRKIQALAKEKERERAEKEAALAEKEAVQLEKEAAQAKEQLERSAKEKLQDELRWTKIPYLPLASPQPRVTEETETLESKPKIRGEEQSQAYADLKTAFFQPADVFLDPDTAHPALLVSDKRILQQAENWQNLPENPERFCGHECALGCESFTSGRHFWEVEVGDRAQWRIGVCRETVSREDGDKMAPENGFWTVGLNPGNDCLALMDPQMTLTNVSPPQRVGVFLDYELGKVSFYNAIDGSHIFTFPPTSFSGPLRPVFGISTFEPTPLTICPG